ncbi:MAG: protein kinase, partial [Phycisphaerae bacterium]
RRVGAGGMGVVFEARQVTTGRRVALKILSPAMTRQKNRLRFLREAEAAARLNHPNIVAVYAIRQDAELCYYAMEFVDGWPLSRVLERLGVTPPSSLPLPEVMRTRGDEEEGASSTAPTVVEERGATGGAAPSAVVSGRAAPAGPRGPSLLLDVSYVRQVVTMIRDVARALDYAHAQGVTHRDIKPDNLLLDHDGRLHLVDFGLARVLEEDNLTLTGELMGTPLYMSPEQVAAGRIGIDHRTDIYSLGVVLYHLLCLQPPYEAPTREALLRAIVIHAPPPLSSRNPSVPRELETIVAHAMEKDPDRRYATGGALADDLDRWLAGEAISLRSPGPLKRWWRRTTPPIRRFVVLSMAILVLFGAGAPLVKVWRDRRVPVNGAPPPADPRAQALERAGSAARWGDYAAAALWDARALELGGSPASDAALRLAMTGHELPPLILRFTLADADRAWDLSPSEPRCALIETDGRMRVWDLETNAPSSPPFGLGLAPRWLSSAPAGRGWLAVERGPDGDALQFWSHGGLPLATQALTGLTGLTHVRAAAGTEGFIVAVMTPAPPPPVPGPPVYRVGVYRFETGMPATLLYSGQSASVVELSPDGRRLARLIRNDQLEIVRLEGGASPPFGHTTISGLAFSPDGKRLAIADSRGEVVIRDTATYELQTIPAAGADTGIRLRAAPAYIRFSPDGEWLLVVGTSRESSPPYLRSIALLDLVPPHTRSFERAGRDGFFAGDGRTLIWWDDNDVSLSSLLPSARPTSLSAAVHARFAGSDSALSADPADADRLAVKTDAQARRMLCAEAALSAEADLPALSVWDLQTGERIWRLAGPPPDLARVGLDPSGRFALAESLGPPRRLSVWDLGDPQNPGLHPRCAPLPVLPVGLDQLKLARGPKIAVLSQESGRRTWSLIDPADPSNAIASFTMRASVEQWRLSEDGTMLLESGEGRLRLRNTADGQPILERPLPDGSTGLAGLSPDGRLLAVRYPGRRLRVEAPLDPAFKPVDIGPLPSDDARVRFSPTGRLLAAADRAGLVVVYDLVTSALVGRFDAGQDVGEMEFCRAERLLAVGQAGGRASVWSISQGRRMALCEPPADATRLQDAATASLPTHIAVRDRAAGAAPALLATACANRILLWALPDPADATTDPKPAPIGAALTTTYGIVAIAFPSCGTEPVSGPGADAPDGPSADGGVEP